MLEYAEGPEDQYSGQIMRREGTSAEPVEAFQDLTLCAMLQCYALQRKAYSKDTPIFRIGKGVFLPWTPQDAEGLLKDPEATIARLCEPRVITIDTRGK